MGTDLVSVLLAAAFEIILLVITVLLAVTYYTFFRMKSEIRRARMFIMSARVQRFLLAFMLGFLSLVITVLASFIGLQLPTALSGAMVFLFVGLTCYGSLELFSSPGRWRNGGRGSGGAR